MPLPLFFFEYHKIAREIYKIIKGEFVVYKNENKYILREGQKLTIRPKEVHFAIGNETWIKVSAKPGWTNNDHILLTTDDIIRDYKAFFSDLLQRLANLKINITGFPISHLTYRVVTLPEYELVRERLKALKKKMKLEKKL